MAAIAGLMSLKEVADFLGVSVQTVYQWRYRNEGPPGYRIGGRVRYRRADLEVWLEEQADRKAS